MTGNNVCTPGVPLGVPGYIPDFSSIVFADEGDILAGSKDTNLDYNKLHFTSKNEEEFNFQYNKKCSSNNGLEMNTCNIVESTI